MSQKVEATFPPCQCWTQPARLHESHCCMVDGATCHQTEGMNMFYSIDPGDPR